MGVINVLDLFITDNSLIIKNRVIRGISDHDAVFIEGINNIIKATVNKQKHRMVPLYRNTDWDAMMDNEFHSFAQEAESPLPLNWVLRIICTRKLKEKT